MLKSHYLLTQQVYCRLPGHFVLHELPQDDHLDHKTNKNQQEQQSQTSSLYMAPQQFVGQFNETGLSWICCCSCKPIKGLELQMYGQKLSRASCESTCCLNVCGDSLVVSTTKKVLLGTIKKNCGGCCGTYLTIENQLGKVIFEIRMKCCQYGNFVPRWLRCTSEVHYEIVNGEGKEVGKVTNVLRSLLHGTCGLRDNFEIQFQAVQRQKDKILLLNAIVFLNQLRHELF